MADDKPSIQIDSDWKRQAQEEKRKLAEQQKQTQTATPPAAAGAGGGTGAGGAKSSARGQRALPQASMMSLIQSLATQIMYYLGDLSPQGAEAGVNLDMAKHLIDTLAVLEDKTRNNLDENERKMLDATLYETRMRYVSVASQYIGPT